MRESPPRPVADSIPTELRKRAFEKSHRRLAACAIISNHKRVVSNRTNCRPSNRREEHAKNENTGFWKYKVSHIVELLYSDCSNSSYLPQSFMGSMIVSPSPELLYNMMRRKQGQYTKHNGGSAIKGQERIQLLSSG